MLQWEGFPRYETGRGTVVSTVESYSGSEEPAGKAHLLFPASYLILNRTLELPAPKSSHLLPLFTLRRSMDHFLRTEVSVASIF